MANGNFDQFLRCLNNEEDDLEESKLLPNDNNATYKNNIECYKPNQNTQEKKINKSHELLDLLFDLEEDIGIRQQLSEGEISTISDDFDIYADIPVIEINRNDTSDTESDDDGVNIIIRDFKSYGQLLFSKNSSETKSINNTNTVKCDLGHVNNKQWIQPRVDDLGYFNCKFDQTSRKASSERPLIKTEAIPVLTSVDCNDNTKRKHEIQEGQDTLNINPETIPVLVSVDCNDNTKRKRKRQEGQDPRNLKIINITEADNNTMFTSEQIIKNGKSLKMMEGGDTQYEQKCSVSCSEKSSKFVLECMPHEESYSNFLSQVENTQLQNKNLSSEPRSNNSPKSTSNSIPKDEQLNSDSCYEESLDSVSEGKLNDDYSQDFLKPLKDKKTNDRSNYKGLPEPITSDYHSIHSSSTKSSISDGVKEPPNMAPVCKSRHPYRSRNRQRDYNRRRSRSWSRSRTRTSPPRRPHTSWDRSRNQYRERKRDRSRSLSRSARRTARSRSPPIHTTRDGLKWQESSKSFTDRRSRDFNKSRNRHHPRHRDRSRSMSRSRRYRRPSRSPPRKRYRRW